jgi:hypothetical protein
MTNPDSDSEIQTASPPPDPSGDLVSYGVALEIIGAVIAFYSAAVFRAENETDRTALLDQRAAAVAHQESLDAADALTIHQLAQHYAAHYKRLTAADD